MSPRSSSYDDPEVSSKHLTSSAQDGTISSCTTLNDNLSHKNTSEHLHGQETSEESESANYSTTRDRICHRPISMCGANYHNHSRRHRCLSLDVIEYEAFIADIPIVKIYTEEWEIMPAYMPRICGVNMGHYFCSTDETASKEKICPSDKLRYPSEFLVPAGMPFSISHSTEFGSIFCTPFFSVIPANIITVPSAIFSLSKLTLSRVINNRIFRHELAFNPNLLIEPPRDISEASTSSKFWTGLQYEVAALIKNQYARAPFPLLADVFEGVRNLMLSILPIEISPYLFEFYDPTRLLYQDISQPICSLYEFIKFTESVIEAIVLPMRKLWVKRMSELFANGTRDVSHLIAGLKTATALLNLTKIDRINSQIKRRIPLLRQNTGKFEKKYYNMQIRSGKIKLSEFSEWLRAQPGIQDFNVTTASISPRRLNPGEFQPIIAWKQWAVEHLVGGFTVNFLRYRSRVPVFSLFSQDVSRIDGLQKRFDHLVYAHLEDYVFKKSEQSLIDIAQARMLLVSPHLCSSKVYQHVESRMLGFVAGSVYENLGYFVFNKSPSRKSGASNWHSKLVNSSSIVSLIHEVTTILLLHWIGANEFYADTSRDLS